MRRSPAGRSQRSRSMRPGMNTLVLDHDPCAAAIRVTSDKLIVDLMDGRTLSVPLSWYPRLAHATPVECANWQLLGDGYAIEWPDLDEHIGVEGLVAGRRSVESKQSIDRWLDSRSTR